MSERDGVISDYLPNESANVVVAVCGEQGSGKTVFLTCVFQSIWNAFPDDVIVDFEREKIGNANYFQSIEDLLIATGQVQGTQARSLFPARIFIRPYNVDPGAARTVLSVDLLDFAGRHFRLFADPNSYLEENGPESEDTKALREVSNTLERADVFIILINSTEIDPLDEAPQSNPFTTSVSAMVERCRERRKPVALLFTQVDQVPALDEDFFRALPKVEEFRRKFTEDREEAHRGGRPFGMARRISCYEVLSGDFTPRRQKDGSIWKREPAQVVLELLRAAMPAVNARLAREREMQIEKDEREREENRRREIERLRKLRGRRLMAGAAAIGALALLVLGLVLWFGELETRKVLLLRRVEAALRKGELARINPADESGMKQILAEHRAHSGGSGTVRAAIRELEAALSEAGTQLAENPQFSASYRDEILRFEGLVQGEDARVPPLLKARSAFLSEWLGTKRPERRARTGFLDGSSERFREAKDLAFARLIAEQSTREKEAEVVGWQSRIDADADVAGRLATIQSLLESALGEGDAEIARIARKALARHLASTILRRHENGLIREKLLTRLTPSLSRLKDGEVRFEELTRELSRCASAEECASHRVVVQDVLLEARATAMTWRAGANNFFGSLFGGVPAEYQGEIWSEMAQGLSEAYLFNLRDHDAWPSDLRPLADTLRDAAEAGEDRTEALIPRMAEHPIYSGELQYLLDDLARRQVVSIYSSLLDELEQRTSVLSTEGLTRISGELEGKDLGRSVAEVATEAREMLQLAESVNSQRIKGRRDSLAQELRLRLISAKQGRCSQWASNEAPAECADAA
jgi:KaiC/GvpD/RAD55 family RecA-like ATPase